MKIYNFCCFTNFFGINIKINTTTLSGVTKGIFLQRPPHRYQKEVNWNFFLQEDMLQLRCWFFVEEIKVEPVCFVSFNLRPRPLFHMHDEIIWQKFSKWVTFLQLNFHGARELSCRWTDENLSLMFIKLNHLVFN